MSVVLDASAILAFVQSERGTEVVEAALDDDPRCGAANWSEVARKVLAATADTAWGSTGRVTKIR